MSLIKKLVDKINEKHSATASFYSFDPMGHSKFYLSALEWVLNEIEKLNKESETNNGWISIDNELPYCHIVCSSDWYEGWSTDKYCPLQIVTKDNMLRTAVLLEMKIQDFHGEKLFWLCDIENLNGKFVIHDISEDFLEIDEVKYWQPLPQPPKE